MDVKKLCAGLWAGRHNQRRWLIALLVAATVWCLVDVRQRGYPDVPAEHRTDLTVYTEAGAAFFDGRQPYEVSNPRGWTYLYPPLLAMLLAPLHLLAEQDQVTVWFFLSLLFCWGCWGECRRIVEIVCRSEPMVAAAWARWQRWLGTAAVLTALLPTLNCLQRGQVGVVKLYLLLLGVRLILSPFRAAWLSWTAGGIVLALPVVMKIVPVVPVGFFVFLQLADFVRSRRAAMIGRRWAFSSLGVAAGLPLFFLFVPAMLVGWRANLGHLDTWGRFMLTKADNGGMDPRSGNSHSARNQSLQNAAYRLGNFTAHLAAAGPDDRLAESFAAPPMAMDSPTAGCLLLMSRAALALALLTLGAGLVRGDGNRLNLAVGFALGCVAMLSVSPVARGHYFLMLAPAVLLVPLWLHRYGRSRAAVAMAVVLPPLCLLHYVLLPLTGRVGLLGLGTTAWLMAAMVMIARTRRSAAGVAEGQDRLLAFPAPAAALSNAA